MNVPREVSHPDIGVVAKVRRANDSLFQRISRTAQQIDGLLGRLERQVSAICLPVVAGADLAPGFALATWFASDLKILNQGTEQIHIFSSSREMLRDELTPILQC